MSIRAPRQAAVVSTPGPSRALTRCAMAVGAAALTACAGAPVRPSPGRCPDGALEAMRKLGVFVTGGASIYTDIRQPGHSGEDLLVHDGPIVSLTLEPYGSLPEGTRLYGRLWTGEGRVTGRYTRAELPDGTSYPVCLVYAGPAGAKWEAGSKPGAVMTTRTFAFIAVDAFP